MFVSSSGVPVEPTPTPKTTSAASVVNVTPAQYSQFQAQKYAVFRQAQLQSRLNQARLSQQQQNAAQQEYLTQQSALRQAAVYSAYEDQEQKQQQQQQKQQAKQPTSSRNNLSKKEVALHERNPTRYSLRPSSSSNPTAENLSSKYILNSPQNKSSPSYLTMPKNVENDLFNVGSVFVKNLSRGVSYVQNSLAGTSGAEYNSAAYYTSKANRSSNPFLKAGYDFLFGLEAVSSGITATGATLAGGNPKGTVMGFKNPNSLQAGLFDIGAGLPYLPMAISGVGEAGDVASAARAGQFSLRAALPSIAVNAGKGAAIGGLWGSIAGLPSATAQGKGARAYSTEALNTLFGASIGAALGGFTGLRSGIKPDFESKPIIPKPSTNEDVIKDAQNRASASRTLQAQREQELNAKLSANAREEELSSIYERAQKNTPKTPWADDEERIQKFYEKQQSKNSLQNYAKLFGKTLKEFMESTEAEGRLIQKQRFFEPEEQFENVYQRSTWRSPFLDEESRIVSDEGTRFRPYVAPFLRLRNSAKLNQPQPTLPKNMQRNNPLYRQTPTAGTTQTTKQTTKQTTVTVPLLRYAPAYVVQPVEPTEETNKKQNKQVGGLPFNVGFALPMSKNGYSSANRYSYVVKHHAINTNPLGLAGSFANAWTQTENRVKQMYSPQKNVVKKRRK